MIRTTVLAVACLLPTTVQSQELLTLDCSFTTTHVVRQESGKAEETTPVAGDSVSMTFSGFDPQTQTVMVVGNQGASKANYMVSDTHLMIVEITDAGNIMVTSIEAPRNRRTVSGVHTRNTWIGPGASISTMTGPCAVR